MECCGGVGVWLVKSESMLGQGSGRSVSSFVKTMEDEAGCWVPGAWALMLEFVLLLSIFSKAKVDKLVAGLRGRVSSSRVLVASCWVLGDRSLIQESVF